MVPGIVQLFEDPVNDQDAPLILGKSPPGFGTYGANRRCG